MNSDRLLIIDDEPYICDIIKEIAEQSGFKVAIAENYLKFESLYKTFEPSLIILDLHMPGCDGIEMLRVLANNKCTAEVLLVSGFDNRVLNTAYQLGKTRGLRMLGSRQKPIDIDDLEALLQKAKRKDETISENSLGEAIDAKQVIIYYQPKVDLTKENLPVVGVESLVRWKHPYLGILPPGRFIPLAEKTRLIKPLTDLVMHTSVAQAKSWNDEGLNLSVAINVPLQLVDDLALPDHVAKLVNGYGIECSRLILEITETAAMADPIKTVEIVTRFRLKGFGLSMDDFGTGYSSLLQLSRMPFNELKIDRLFVVDIDQNKEAEIITRLSIDLAHHLGMTVCAEGVESPDALRLLRTMGCDRAQGYFICKPVSAEELPSAIAEWNNKAQSLI